MENKTEKREYKPILVKELIHKKVKMRAVKEEISMGELIEKLLNLYPGVLKNV